MQWVSCMALEQTNESFVLLKCGEASVERNSLLHVHLGWCKDKSSHMKQKLRRWLSSYRVHIVYGFALSGDNFLSWSLGTCHILI